jgi:hypothetical protein
MHSSQRKWAGKMVKKEPFHHLPAPSKIPVIIVVLQISADIYR